MNRGNLLEPKGLPSALADLLADNVLAARQLHTLLGFKAPPREVDAGVWLLGYWRGSDQRPFYYAGDPARLLAVLQTDRHAVFAYGHTKNMHLPRDCAERGRSLGQLLMHDVHGHWCIDTHVLNGILPAKHAGLRRGMKGGAIGCKGRILAWTQLMVDWYAELQSDSCSTCRPPSWSWIMDWFRTKAPRDIRLQAPSKETLKHDVGRIRKVEGDDPISLVSAQFLLLWANCRDEYYVRFRSCKLLAKIAQQMSAYAKAPPPDLLVDERIHDPAA
ncbi:MAG: hypothetical protein MJ240_12525 [Kiritimatiellae bacterium]|nr:hypothetical protein [Kiritimatiellia bacterium]